MRLSFSIPSEVGSFLYDTAEKAGILEEVAGNAKYYVRDGALKKFLKKVIPPQFQPEMQSSKEVLEQMLFTVL